MVILTLPMFSVRALNADSNYVILSQVIPHILKKRPDWLFDILWPSNGSDWLYYKDGFFDNPNVKRTPIYFDPAKMRQVVAFEGRQWQKLLGYKDNHYDIIWNNTVEFGDLIKFFEPRYVPNAQSAVANFHHYVLHESLSYPVRKTYEHVVIRQVVASLGVDVNIVNSDHTEMMLNDNATDYLAPAQATRLEESIRKINYGTLDPDLVAATQQPKHDKFTFAYNHRLQDYKKWRTTFAVYDRLWESHPNQFAVEVYAAGASDRLADVARRPYVRIVHPKNHNEYLPMLSRCHANIMHSVYETLCVSALESMAYGQILIAPNGVTFPEITGAAYENKGYPYLFNNEEESYVMAASLLDEGDHGWGEKTQEYVLDVFSASTTAGAVIDLFEGIADDLVVWPTLKRKEEWKSLIESQTDWAMSDLRRVSYSRLTHDGKHMAAGQSFPAVKIKRIANELGYRDMWGSDGKLHLVRTPKKGEGR